VYVQRQIQPRGQLDRRVLASVAESSALDGGIAQRSMPIRMTGCDDSGSADDQHCDLLGAMLRRD
jgi:hypothetical protein